MKKRFLCVCQHGNVRSVALAFLLHDRHRQEAIPVGWDRLSDDSLRLFCHWADTVIILQEEFRVRIPLEFQHKIKVIDVGPDRFGVKINKELRGLLEPSLANWKAEGFI